MIGRLDDQARSEMTSHNQNEELKAALEKVQEQLEAEKEEHRREMEELQKARESDKEEHRQEFLSMLAAQRQGTLQQVIVMFNSNNYES